MDALKIQQIKEYAVKEGIASLYTEKYKSKFILEGGEIGFKKTLTLNTKQEFEKAIAVSQKKSQKLMLDNKEDKESVEKYWRQRYETLQLEWMFEVMKYIWGGFETYSARAGVFIGNITKKLGIAEEELGAFKDYHSTAS